MIHEPEVEVTCDECGSSVYLPMRWTVNGYNLKSDLAEKALESDHNWTLENGNHFCNESCANSQ